MKQPQSICKSMCVLYSNKILFLNSDILIYIIFTLKIFSFKFLQLFRNVKIILSPHTISEPRSGAISFIGHSSPIQYLEKETNSICGPYLRQYSFEVLHLLSDMLIRQYGKTWSTKPGLQLWDPPDYVTNATSSAKIFLTLNFLNFRLKSHQ